MASTNMFVRNLSDDVVKEPVNDVTKTIIPIYEE